MFKEIIIFLFGLGVGYVFSCFWCMISRTAGQKLFKKIGYHLHHTLLGVAAIIVAFLFSRHTTIFLFGCGLATIFHDFFVHNKKLKFITKE